MPIVDSRFEDYLRAFRPLEAAELKLKYSRSAYRSSRLRWGWLGATAAILCVTVFLWHGRTDDRVPVGTPAIHCCTSPLTLGAANATIFGPGSTRESLDRLVFPQQIKLPKGEQSALTVLGEEKTEL
jgi:hypothetical protein